MSVSISAIEGRLSLKLTQVTAHRRLSPRAPWATMISPPLPRYRALPTGLLYTWRRPPYGSLSPGASRSHSSFVPSASSYRLYFEIGCTSSGLRLQIASLLRLGQTILRRWRRSWASCRWVQMRKSRLADLAADGFCDFHNLKLFVV